MDVTFSRPHLFAPCHLFAPTKRRGPKRATLAVAHAQLCTVYAMLKNKTSYADLGGDPFERNDGRDGQRQAGRLVNRLQRLGFRVTIEPAAAA